MLSRLNQLDSWFFASLFRLNSRRGMSRTITFISHTGDGYLYPIIGLLAYFFAPEKAPAFLKATCMALIIELPSYKILKYAVKRDRPFMRFMDVQNLIVPIERFSFPSGHTGAAVVVATNIWFFFPQLGILAAGWAGLIALSRIIVGVHYPSDVLGGVFIGGFSTWAGFAILM